MVSLDEWRATGDHLEIGGRRIFHRVEGDGPWTTFLHGFPTNSYDWHAVAGRLPSGHRRLYIDHLGFGASDAPVRHAYTFDEQLDVLLALWRYHGVAETVLVAHDYSVSIVQEILARRLAGAWEGPALRAVLLLNGGLFKSVQRPLPIQHLLRLPAIGPALSRLAPEAALHRSMRRICAIPPSLQALHEHWRSMQDARPALHALSAYHGERRRNEARWTAAMAACDVPMRLAWGMQDPVSGAAMLQAARDRIRPAVTEWAGVGHYPMLEDPDAVAKVVARTEAYGVR